MLWDLQLLNVDLTNQTFFPKTNMPDATAALPLTPTTHPPPQLPPPSINPPPTASNIDPLTQPVPLPGTLSLLPNPPSPAPPLPQQIPDDALDLEMPPTRAPEKSLVDYGTPLPPGVIEKRISLAGLGQFQQKVWYQDIKEVYRHLKGLTSWLKGCADDLGPSDSFSHLLREAVGKIPFNDFEGRIQTAQLCLDEVKIQYELARKEVAMRRGRLRGYDPEKDIVGDAEDVGSNGNGGAVQGIKGREETERDGEREIQRGMDRERTATVAPDSAAERASPTILVVSDILQQNTAAPEPEGVQHPNLGPRNPPALAPASTVRAQMKQRNGEPVGSPNTEKVWLIPRRSAMLPTPIPASNPSRKRKAKPPASATYDGPSSVSGDTHSEASEVSEEELPSINQLRSSGSKTATKRSGAGGPPAHNVRAQEDDKAPATKRFRAEYGECSRPNQREQGSLKSGEQGNAPVAFMG